MEVPSSLRRRPVAPDTPLRLEPAAVELLRGGEGFRRLLGGPGSGKTTLLAHAAADRLLRERVTGGVGQRHTERVLVLTSSRRAAESLRSLVTAQLTLAGAATGGLRTAREPVVRTVHSFAFAILRRQAMLRGDPPPRLLSGPEQDAVVRELLAGDLEAGARSWPPRLRPALPLPGFAAELRDLMLRAAERGLGPEDLIDFGRDAARDEWVASGRFARQYEQVTLLQGAVGTQSPQATAPALDAAELVAAALLAVDTDEELLTAERAAVRYLFVDDAQHLDPLQYRLLRVFGASAREFVLAGDPEQAIFGFRGSDPSVLLDADPGGAHTLTLRAQHRMTAPVLSAAGRVARAFASRATGSTARGDPVDDPAGTLPSQVDVRLFTSPAAEAAWVADELRRAHLQGRVPWSKMAVVVRSALRSLPVLRRALLGAGVPLNVPAAELPLAREPAVRPFLELVRCAAYQVSAVRRAHVDPLDPEIAELLLASPIGGADALAMRRLRRGLRRLEIAAGGSRPSGELLIEALRTDDVLAALSEVEAAPVRRVAGLLAAACAELTGGSGVEQVLWRLWQDSGLAERWVQQSAQRGRGGAAADRDLDAVVELFSQAARYADRLPGAGAGEFADYLAAQRIVGDSLAERAPVGEAVSLLTAHAAAGREWTVVAVPGVQEGSWPDLRLRGSLLGVERLVDALTGVASEGVSATAPLLAEERRLFYVAVTRARQRLLVSAVRTEDEQPSRFLEEVADPDEHGFGADTERPVRRPRRGLALPELVGELRGVACDERADPARRQRAARQLARLAAAGVPGAHPSQWHGLAEPSTRRPLRSPDAPVGVSPSAVEALLRCPLRWMLERHGGAEVAETPAIAGRLVHALAQAAAAGADAAELAEALREAWRTVDAGAPWFSRLEAQRLGEMIERFRRWLAASRVQLKEVGLERELSVTLPESPQHPDAPRVRVRGRVDRLEVDVDGRPVVIDLKTGKTPVSKLGAAENPQLALYQLAVAFGAFGELANTPGGARLVYLAKEDSKTGGPQERSQPALDPDQLAAWLARVAEAGSITVGPTFLATVNPDCPRCPVRTSCPVHDSGRQVSQGAVTSGDRPAPDVQPSEPLPPEPPEDEPPPDPAEES